MTAVCEHLRRGTLLINQSISIDNNFSALFLIASSETAIISATLSSFHDKRTTYLLFSNTSNTNCSSLMPFGVVGVKTEPSGVTCAIFFDARWYGRWKDALQKLHIRKNTDRRRYGTYERTIYLSRNSIEKTWFAIEPAQNSRRPSSVFFSASSAPSSLYSVTLGRPQSRHTEPTSSPGVFKTVWNRADVLVVNVAHIRKRIGGSPSEQTVHIPSAWDTYSTKSDWSDASSAGHINDKHHFILIPKKM